MFTKILALTATVGMANAGEILKMDRCVHCKTFDWQPSTASWQNHGLKFQEQLDDRFFIAYEVDEEAGYATFAMTAHTEGWIGFGPTETGGMIGGNPCVVMEVDGVAEAIAMHSMEFTRPTVNADQNCELLEYESGNGETYAKIRRPLNGCAPEDIEIHDRWEKRYFAAWGDSHQFSYHGDKRAYLERDIFNGALPDQELPDDAFYIDVFLDETELPAQRDIYYAKAWKMPDDRRYHVLGAQPMLDPETILPAMYHHYIAYQCPGDQFPLGYEEGEQIMDSFMKNPCLQFWTGWAIGQGDIWMGDTADGEGLGMAVGDGVDSNAPVYFMLEAHVDNVYETVGLRSPAWGMRLWFTAELQPVESGVIGLAVLLPILRGIGTGFSAYKLTGECPTGCTNQHFPEDGITIQSVAPHMHYAGRGMTVKVIRDRNNGNRPNQQDWAQTDEMIELLHWDANWQGIIRHNPNKPVKVYPGDRIETTCIYNTEDRDRPVRNGEGFLDEMCIPFVQYYPAMNIGWCASLGDNNETGAGALCNAGIGDNPALPFGANLRPQAYEPMEEVPNNCAAGITPPPTVGPDHPSGCGANNEHSNMVACLLAECPRINIADCIACIGCMVPGN
jgi:hypothetical protein